MMLYVFHQDHILRQSATGTPLLHDFTISIRLMPRIRPSIPAAYAAQLKAFCPRKTFNDTVIVQLDVVSPLFEAGYYVILTQRKGVFSSDQILFDDPRTRPLVKSLTDNKLFQTELSSSFHVLLRITSETQTVMF